MTHPLRSFAVGAAVAALLILPARAGNDWMRLPQKTYAVDSVKIDDMAATLNIDVKPSGPATLEVSGVKERVHELEISTEGRTLRIEGVHSHSVWDWHDWFNFSSHGGFEPQQLVIKLAVPKGTALRISDLVGHSKIGDTMGPLDFEAASSTATIGRVGQAKISLAGSGKIDIAEVNGPLSLEIAGSGKVRSGNSGPVHADVAGAGDAQLGNISGGLKISIAGSGTVAAASVNGPVKVSIAGSGSIRVAKGVADPLHVSIMGSGNFDFGGNAVDPHLSALGSGRVRLKSYTGHLSNTGSLDVLVGGKSVSMNRDTDDDDDDD